MWYQQVWDSHSIYVFFNLIIEPIGNLRAEVFIYIDKFLSLEQFTS